MKWILSAAIVITVLAATASAKTIRVGGAATPQSRWYNRDGLGSAKINQISWFATNGDKADADISGIFQTDPNGNSPGSGLFWAHGLAGGCGARSTISSPYCGENMYNSTDLVNWTYIGQLFNPNVGTWQTDCAGNSSIGGCFVSRIVYNAANNNYVLWLNDAAATQRQRVLISSVPQGPYVQQADPTHLAISNPGDESLFVDPTSGIGYVVYETYGAGQLYVQQLNAAYTDAVGTATTPSGFAGDTPYIFGPVGGVYHWLWSSACALCPGAAVHHATASTPLGTWTQLADVSSDACGGQFVGAYPLVISGQQVYLFQSVLNSPAVTVGTDPYVFNEYIAPLTWSGTTLNNVVCQDNITFALPSTTVSIPPPAVDQTDELFLPGFGVACDITTSKNYFQQFVPTAATVSAVALPTAQGTAGCGTGCTGANGNLTMSVTTVDGSGNPATVLQSVTASNTGMTFQPKRQLFNLSPTLSVTPGTTYGIELVGANSAGCFFVAPSYNSPYTRGITKISTNGGSSWNAAGFSLRFSTIP